MPRYYKNGGKSGYKKRFKALTHEKAAQVFGNLSPVQFSRLQELSRHGMGDYTMFRKLLSKHTKTKTKGDPSSFQIIANAQGPHEIIAALRQEKEDLAQDSQTDLGGGIRDAVNDLGRWSYKLLDLPHMKWAYDKLDHAKLAQTNNVDVDPHKWMHDILGGSVTTDTGGGLKDALGASLGAVYNFSPFSVAYDWIQDKRGLSDIKTKMTDMQKWDADTIEEAYKKQGSRDATTSQGWKHMPQYDGAYTSVYRNPRDNSLHVGIRGSQTLKDWTFHDALIMGRNKPGAEETERIQQFLVQLSKENPDVDITVNSHSLSGSFVQNAFTDATPEEAKWLDRYDTINLYNPGSNALANMDHIHEFVQDERVHLFLNKTDAISTSYAQAITDDSRDRVVFGNATLNPLGAHTFSQWQSDETIPEYVPEPETDLGGGLSWINEILSA